MFCPQCRSEYRPGFIRCNDCDADLVWELPRDEEHGEPNQALIAVAESVLGGADIPCVIRNKYVHRALGGDVFTVVPAQVFVRDDDAGDARELLADLSRYDDAQGRE